tara:strand:- start:601 stop:1656 length:1056 start_codon:yes stop_codon:yes gene_type:complete
MQTNAGGGFFTNQTLSRQLRAVSQPLTRFRQFTKKDGQFGKRSGQKLLFNKLKNLGASATNGAIIAEGQPIPRDGFEIAQGECIAQPSGQAIPWTEEFAAQSEFDVNEPIESRALDHMAKSLDYRAAKPFRDAAQSKITYVPTGAHSAKFSGLAADKTDYTFTATANGTPGAAATRALRAWDYRNVADMLKSGRYLSSVGNTLTGADAAPAPTWDGQSYICIVGVEGARGLKEDAKWEEAQYYGDPEKLFTGEIGRLSGIRFIEENHILQRFTTGGSYDDVDPGGEAIMIAKDPAMECVVIPEEVRVDIPRDFGRDQAMAWYYLGGWAAVWNGTDGDNRVVRMTSTTLDPN